ncbi:MAG: DUF2795 domain-containing protein [Ardenticatenaceae bacterium]|nr:DUF2795 domain-containing protein [Ardenticatenaceae bacterium]
MASEKQRPYDASDLKELMDNAGEWAKNWGDVLQYLRGPAQYDADFAKDEVPALMKDVENLKQRRVKFTTDYRKMWKEISGEEGKNLPPPEDVKKSATNPVELEDKYLKGLKFPASTSDVIANAKSHNAPERVMDVLKRIDDEQYQNMGRLLESVGDETRDHD